MTPFIALDETTRQINETADIVEVVGEYVSLTKAGVNYKGLCPFHSEKTPSFTVNPSRKSFHCFGCNEGGDTLDFIMRYHNLSFPDAVKQLAGRYHIAVPERELSPYEQEKVQKKKNIYLINEKAVDIYHEYLLHDPAAKGARLYLQSRGIPENVITGFRLGFAPESWDFLLKKLGQFPVKEVEEAGLIVPKDNGGHYDRFRNRVLCPIFNVTGKALGFGGRILDVQGSSNSAAIHKGPKYLNSPESPVYNKSKVLFGLFQNKDAIRRSKQCLVVEGNFDLLSLVAQGISNVTAPLGTALTKSHVKALKGYVSEVIILFDGDKAGINAALRAVPIFLSEQLAAKVVVLPENHDPDTFVKEVGADGFQEYLKKAYPLPEFVFDRLLNKHGFSLAGKSAIVDDLKPIVAAIPDDQLQRSLFLSHFSQKLGLTAEQMLHGIPVSSPVQVKKKAVEISETQDPHSMDLSRIEEQLLSFLVVYPEHFPQLAKAGLSYAIQSYSGKVIFEKLTELSLENEKFAPESLIESVSGSERQFISKCLMDIEELSDLARKDEAEEKSRWLAENSRKWQMKELTKQINQAQQENNQIRLMELLQEKNKIREIDQVDR